MSFWSEAVAKWELSRNGVAGEVRALREGGLDSRCEPGARTARETAVHLLESGVAFTAALEQGVSWVQPPKMDYSSASKDELADALLAQWAELKPRLERLEAREGETRDGFFGPATQLTNLWFAIAHEWYHQGQLALHVRLSGEVPALTRMIEKMSQAQPEAAPTT
jgi:uncharacterized damage-inducible protein DinB